MFIKLFILIRKGNRCYALYDPFPSLSAAREGKTHHEVFSQGQSFKSNLLWISSTSILAPSLLRVNFPLANDWLSSDISPVIWQAMFGSYFFRTIFSLST